MKEPFANLDANSIDERIEHILQTIPARRDYEDSSYLRDLQYLYRKEDILARAQQRLMIASLPEQTHARGSQKTSTDAAWREHSTMLSRSQTHIVRKPFSWPKIAAVLAAALLLIGVMIETTSLFSARIQQTPGSGHKGSNTTATTTATATLASTIVFSDPLDQNIHNWPDATASDNTKSFVFKSDGYHITNLGNSGAAASIPEVFSQNMLTYQITMQEIAGDDTDITNNYGLILRHTTHVANGQLVETFYSFEILNNNNHSMYTFYKYDGSQKTTWKSLWSAKVGQEFHAGHGPNAINIVKVIASGSTFTFFVNGQQVGTMQDGSYASGSVGMVVHLKGTEVVFSNLLITQP